MSSLLNPEAPEFYPHLKATTKDTYVNVNKSIRSSNLMPSGYSHELYKTYTEFNVITSKLGENVIVESNNIIVTELPAVKLRVNDNDSNTEKVIHTNDSLLDRLNVTIDTVKGVNKPNQKFIEGVNKPNISSWNNRPVIEKIQIGSATFIGAKNIPRPQLNFKDTIDNSENLWVPKISDKPNNIKPLVLNIIYNEDGKAVGYEHPYKVELELYHPPAEFLEPDQSPPELQKSLASTKLTYVDTEAQIDQLVTHLTQVKQFAVDVEHHSYRTYQGITCLIQISTDEGGDFIIDTLAAREYIHKLNLAFTNPKILKVFHGADMDVIWLQRDFGVYIVGLFDTHQAARILKVSNGYSLKNLLLKYCQVDTDKKYQLADWRIRPLPEELVEYARVDTHYLLYIWRQMKQELLNQADGQPHLLLNVFEKSRQICAMTYNKEVIDDRSHLPLYIHSKKSFNSRQLAALKMLYKWRDTHARELDESPSYILPNNMVLSLAEHLPREVQGVHACCNPMPPVVKQHLITLHRMILSCRELPVEPALYEMPASISTMVNQAHQLAHTFQVHDLSQYTEYVDQNINLDLATRFALELQHFQPDIKVFVTPFEQGQPIVSDLNVEAKLFIPPYDRYRKYRALAQMEEMKEFKEKEAKIAAISKDNQLIKQEVLAPIQHAKEIAEEEICTKPNKQVAVSKEVDSRNTHNHQKQRKRKISSEKPEKDAELNDNSNKDIFKQKNNKMNTVVSNVKAYTYKNANYKKFLDVDKLQKPSKTKVKNPK